MTTVVLFVAGFCAALVAIVLGLRWRLLHPRLPALTAEEVTVEIIAGAVFSPEHMPERLFAEDAAPIAKRMVPTWIGLRETVTATYSGSDLEPVTLETVVPEEDSDLALAYLRVDGRDCSALSKAVLGRGSMLSAGFGIDCAVASRVPPPPSGYPRIPSCVSVKVVLTLRGYATVAQ